MSASGTVRLGAHAPACPAGELARRLRGALDDRRDLVEGHGEDVVQHEREPLRRRQRVQHREQRQADRIGQQRLVLGIDPVHPVDDRIREPSGERLLPPRFAGAEHVQRDPSDDGRQPGVEVLEPACVGAVKPEPRLLHRVVRLAQRAEHPIGHRAETGSAFLESFCQPLSLVHRSRSSVALGLTEKTRELTRT